MPLTSSTLSTEASVCLIKEFLSCGFSLSLSCFLHWNLHLQIPLQTHEMSHGSRGTKHLPITQPHLNCCHNRHIPMGWVTLLNKHWRSRVTPCTDWLWLHLLSFLCLPGFLVSLTGVLTVTWRVPLLPCLYCLVQAFSLFFYFFYIFPKTGLKLYIVMNDLELLIFLLLPFQCWDYGYWWPCPM